MPDANEIDKHGEWWVNVPPDEFLRIVWHETTVDLAAIEGMVQLLLLSPALKSIMDTSVVDHLTLRQILNVISEHRSRTHEELLTAIPYAKAYARGEIPSKTSKIANLNEIVNREVDLYSGDAAGAMLHPLLDNQRQIYAVIAAPADSKDRPAWVVMMARVVGEYVIIDEDTTDKPLVDALMINGGIRREQIILAYAGETLPAQQTK